MKTHGYNGTGVKDIVDAAKVPKGSFYNYFDSKEAFALEALEAVADDDIRVGQKLLSANGKSALGRLQYYFEQATLRFCEDNFKCGCFFGNLGQEMADSNEAIREKVRQILDRNTQLIKAVIDEAKDSGEIKSETQTDVLAEFIINAWEGTLLRMKTSRTREPLDTFLNMLPQIVK